MAIDEVFFSHEILVIFNEINFYLRIIRRSLSFVDFISCVIFVAFYRRHGLGHWHRFFGSFLEHYCVLRIQFVLFEKLIVMHFECSKIG